MFQAAAAGGAPTGRRLHDTHWEERFLGHPEAIPENHGLRVGHPITREETANNLSLLERNFLKKSVGREFGEADARTSVWPRRREIRNHEQISHECRSRESGIGQIDVMNITEGKPA
ncbi:hypothetical protein [Streptomyces sp. NPDC057729]|uniref:hypothetical protein n=1 Tax=Streptomyces sp. NPDC057729 TaxID=3346230 RepID=UPI00368F3880